MGVYNNNKDGTRSTLANTIQVVEAPMEQFVSRGEFSAVTPSDVSADNKLVAENEVTKAVDTMPTAGASLVGTIVQYVGTTTANYTNGYFYKCVSDGAITPTYSWVEVISGGGGGSTVVVTQTLSSGTKIGSISVDGNSTDLFAPNGSASTTTISNPTTIKAYAHRGCNQMAPDCSKPSWEWAKKLGFYGLEVDIWSTSDNVFVVYHDPSINNLTNKTGVITDKTWDFISSAVYDKGNFVNEYPNLHISRIEELFVWAKANNMPLLLDVKTIHSYEDLVALIIEYDLTSSCVIASQSLESLRLVSNIAPNISLRTWGASTLRDDIDNASTFPNCDCSASFSDITKADIEYAHSKGVKIGAYCENTSLESQSLYYKMAYYGIDTITTNGLLQSNIIPNCKVISTKAVDELANTRMYGQSRFSKAQTLSELQSATATDSDVLLYYSNGENLFVEKKEFRQGTSSKYSGALQQTIYANVGDIIEIEVESKAEDISDQGKVFSIYTYPNNSITKPTDASVTGLYEEDFSTSTTQDPYVMDWKKHILRYIATTNGLYVIQYGLKGSQNGTIYLRSFNVNVYKTGLVKNVGMYENKVLLKNFDNNVSSPNNCRLHRSVSIFKFLELHFDWDGTTFITQIPCNETNTTTFSTSWVYTTSQAKFFVIGARATFSISGVISDALEYNTLVIQNTVKVIDENGISDSGSSSNFKLKRVYGIY